MKDIDLVGTMAAKLNGVMLLELNMRTPKGLEALRSLMNSNLESLLVVLPVNNADHTLDEGGAKRVAPRGKGKTDPDASPRAGELTAREQEILALIAEGMTNKMIAQQLEISDSTVKVHVKNVLRKLKVNSRLAAAVRALRPRKANGSDWSQDYERN